MLCNLCEKKLFFALSSNISCDQSVCVVRLRRRDFPLFMRRKKFEDARRTQPAFANADVRLEATREASWPVCLRAITHVYAPSNHIYSSASGAQELHVRVCVFACVTRVSSHVSFLTEITSHRGKHTSLHQESHSQSKVSTQVSSVRANSDKCGLRRPAVQGSHFESTRNKTLTLQHAVFQDAVKRFFF